MLSKATFSYAFNSVLLINCFNFNLCFNLTKIYFASNILNFFIFVLKPV